MCGRFAIYDIDALAERFSLAKELPLNLKANFNAAPNQFLPVIIRNDKNELTLMRWGLVPSWAKDESVGMRMINARVETIAEKPSFRRALRQRRCIVPVNGFYEWQIDKTNKLKTPFYFHRKDDDLFALAGLYEAWITPDHQTLDTFTIVTTAPNAVVAPIHNRMPLILDTSDESTWLDHETNVESLTKLLTSHTDDQLVTHPVSIEVNAPDNNSPHLIDPV